VSQGSRPESRRGAEPRRSKRKRACAATTNRAPRACSANRGLQGRVSTRLIVGVARTNDRHRAFRDETPLAKGL
jgi:hypothetical protein